MVAGLLPIVFISVICADYSGVYAACGNNTVEPLNNRHIETDHLSIIERLSSFRGKNCHYIYVGWCIGNSLIQR